MFKEKSSKCTTASSPPSGPSLFVPREKLRNLRTKETEVKHNYEMLSQSLQEPSSSSASRGLVGSRVFKPFEVVRQGGLKGLFFLRNSKSKGFWER